MSRSEMLARWQEVLDHWEDMAQHGRQAARAPVWHACAFCLAFMRGGCGGCPVGEAGHFECNDTPYWDVWDAWSDADIPNSKVKAAARKMRTFLRKLYAQWLKDNPEEAPDK